MSPIPPPAKGSCLLSNRELPQIPTSLRTVYQTKNADRLFMQWVERFHESGIDARAIDSIAHMALTSPDAKRVLQLIDKHRNADWLRLRLSESGLQRLKANTAKKAHA